MRVIINGIGVAGPALAFWLHRSGHEVTLVESAPELRTAGYVIDFWGIGYDIAERMGLIDEIRALGYQMQEVRFVDRAGETNGGFGVDVFRRMTHDRFTSVRRSDISATIYRAIEGKVESIFGDSVAAIEERGERVHVSFDHAPSRDADLVIGADGLHSRVRQIAFGAEVRVRRPARLPRRRLRGERLSSARGTGVRQPRTSRAADLALLDARRPDAIPLHLCRPIPRRRRGAGAHPATRLWRCRLGVAADRR